MLTTKPRPKISHIFCPTDLSDRSQKALGIAARLAETLHADLTACHCLSANWFTAGNGHPKERIAEIKTQIRDLIKGSQNIESSLTWRSLIVENSFDVARDILRSSRETGADLIVMKARPGVLSAIHFGSLVERVVEASACPVLLLPSRYLDDQDPVKKNLEFRRILFDYDFSDAADHLSGVVTALTEGYSAELRVLSVLDPVGPTRTEAAPLPFSRSRVQTLVRHRLTSALESEGILNSDTQAAVEWGQHAETVLEYATTHHIDLICTSLTPVNFYFEKLYRGYLGRLLRSAKCPILLKQSAGSGQSKTVE